VSSAEKDASISGTSGRTASARAKATRGLCPLENCVESLEADAAQCIRPADAPNRHIGLDAAREAIARPGTPAPSCNRNAAGHAE
jgi:hypothetical protein